MISRLRSYLTISKDPTRNTALWKLIALGLLFGVLLWLCVEVASQYFDLGKNPDWLEFQNWREEIINNVQ